MEFIAKLFTAQHVSHVLAFLALLCHVVNIKAAIISLATEEKATTLSPELETMSSDAFAKNSFTNVKNTFRGLLYTTEEIIALENEFNNNRNNYLVSQGLTKTTNVAEPETLSDDGGSCCSTHVQHIANTTLKNIYGEDKTVIHLSEADPPSFQYIPHAKCVFKGNCDGTCIIEPKLMFLLVIDQQQGYKFDAFEIPGYCSCKNIYM